jgi:hypothetical protein
VLAGEDGGRKALGIALAETRGTNRSAATPRALGASILARQAGLFGGIRVTSGAGDGEHNSHNKQKEMHFFTFL